MSNNEPFLEGQEFLTSREEFTRINHEANRVGLMGVIHRIIPAPMSGQQDRVHFELCKLIRIHNHDCRPSSSENN